MTGERSSDRTAADRLARLAASIEAARRLRQQQRARLVGRFALLGEALELAHTEVAPADEAANRPAEQRLAQLQKDVGAAHAAEEVVGEAAQPLHLRLEELQQQIASKRDHEI